MADQHQTPDSKTGGLDAGPDSKNVSSAAEAERIYRHELLPFRSEKRRGFEGDLPRFCPQRGVFSPPDEKT